MPTVPFPGVLGTQRNTRHCHCLACAGTHRVLGSSNQGVRRGTHVVIEPNAAQLGADTKTVHGRLANDGGGVGTGLDKQREGDGTNDRDSRRAKLLDKVIEDAHSASLEASSRRVASCRIALHHAPNMRHTPRHMYRSNLVRPSQAT